MVSSSSWSAPGLLLVSSWSAPGPEAGEHSPSVAPQPEEQDGPVSGTHRPRVRGGLTLLLLLLLLGLKPLMVHIWCAQFSVQTDL